MNTATIDLEAARRTVDAVGEGITRIADELIDKGAPKQMALEVATDHVLACMSHDRPRLHARYLRAVAAVTEADGRPRPGSRFVREVSILGKRGKTHPVTYTVTGSATHKGRLYVTTYSDYQGDGSCTPEQLSDVMWISPEATS